MASLKLTDVKGVGTAYARHLRAAGIGSVEALVDSDLETLSALPRVGRVRAVAMRTDARALLDRFPGGTPAAAPEPAPLPPAGVTGGAETAGREPREERRSPVAVQPVIRQRVTAKNEDKTDKKKNRKEKMKKDEKKKKKKDKKEKKEKKRNKKQEKKKAKKKKEKKSDKKDGKKKKAKKA